MYEQEYYGHLKMRKLQWLFWIEGDGFIGNWDEKALVIVSWVVKVFETIINNVSAASSSRTVSAKLVASILEIYLKQRFLSL